MRVSENRNASTTLFACHPFPRARAIAVARPSDNGTEAKQSSSMTSFLQLRRLPRPKLRALHTYGKMCRKGPGRSIQVYIVRHDIRSPARTEFSNLIHRLSQSCSARQELSERASPLDRTRRDSLRPDRVRPAASA